MRVLLAGFLALTLTGCASMRKVDVGSGDTTQSGAVEVTNNRTGTITVSYSDGTDTRQLGTVAPGRAERFVIAGSRQQQITVIAVTSGGASAGNYPVTLESGITKRITVR